MKIKQNTLILIICLFTLFVRVQSQNATDKKCLFITNRWLTECLDLTKNCVGYSAPVSARSFAYLSVGFYECAVENQEDCSSLSNQLDGYVRTSWAKNKNTIYWPHVCNYFSYSLIKQLYANMPPSNLKKVQLLKDSIYKDYKNETTQQQIKLSEEYATKLLIDIKQWADADGGNSSYNKNFPSSFGSPKCLSCWETTFPGYLKALQPYWGNNRLLLKSNSDVTNFIKSPIFSTDTNSAFYKDALSVFKNYESNKKNSELIAEYWDDAAGYSGTPSGHLFFLAKQLVSEHNFELKKALQFYVLLGISVNDAFIVCWQQKYKYNLLRPITYIQRYISPNFNTIIPTPPFPEFPSGHSMQSGAAGEVFKFFLSDTLKIIDVANKNRVDINGEPRAFKNINEMIEEISKSRFYGGIHFMNTLNQSVEYGKKIGQNTISTINFISK